MGAGSECFGFEDELSLDHDMYVGFQLFLRKEDAEAIGFELSTLYDRLPREFMGLSTEHRSRMGDGKHGVKVINDFYRPFTGTDGAPQTWRQWLHTPSWALAQATNGEVFTDPLGEFTSIRQEILLGMPEDVRKKKIAARAAIMAQSGQYNHPRCMKRGEKGAALLAADEFVRNASELFFLLNRRHMPYYKWCFRAMTDLPGLGNLKDALEFLLTGENDQEGQKLKVQLVEDVCAAVVKELQSQHLTCGSWDYLEKHALDMHGHIQNGQLSSLHILEGW